MIRKIIEIDKEKCNGCAACAKACHEGAIAMIDNKATLVRDDYCDGLGDCLPTCPTNAISFVEREAAEFDPLAVKKRQEKLGLNKTFSCPGQQSIELNPNNKTSSSVKQLDSKLKQWPVQIKLAPSNAPYFDNANLLIAADCSAYAFANFHNEFIENHITLIGCPKLDYTDYSEKLSEILSNNNIKSVTVVRMEVPCCKGIETAVVLAFEKSKKLY